MAGGFDTSNVAATVGQNVPPFDPFATVGKFAAIQNALNQNKLFQAKQLGGQAYAASLNPDGSINQNALTGQLQADPRLGIVAPELSQSALTLGTGQQTLAATQRTAGENILGSVLPDPSITDVTTRDLDQKKRAAVALSRAVQSGVLPHEMATQIVGNGFPGLTTADASAQAALQTGNAAEIGQQVGTPISVDTGAATQLLNEKPVEGTAALIKSIPKALPPTSTNTAAYERYNPVTHQMETVTQAQAAAAPPTGAIPAAAPLGEPEAAAGSAQQLVADRQAATTAQTRLLSLQKALQGVQNAQTGPGSDAINQVKSFALTLAPDIAKAIGIDPNKIQSFDEANKYLTQYAQTLAGGMGRGTDAQLASAITGNASTHISNLAAQDVIKVTMGIERFRQAQIAAFEAQGEPGGAAGYQNWAQHWAQTVDPRGFMLDQLSKAERQKMLSTIKTPEQKRAIIAAKAAAEAAGQYSEPDIPR